MPTTDRVRARADARRWLTLQEAARLAPYSAETLRKMMWYSATPPPLEKIGRRWHVRADRLAAWLDSLSDDAVAS